MRIGTLLLVLVTQISFAQVTKNLGDFDNLKVFDRLNVKLIPSTENKIEITGERENEVEIVTKNGELKLRMPFPKLLSGNDIIIKLYFKRIESIDANEGAYVACYEPFNQNVISINSSEGAEIILILDVQKANVRAVTAGIIELEGKATNQDVSITSGGIVYASKLETSQTTVSVSAGGLADVFASVLVDAKVKAGGSIVIFGKPEQINQKTVLGGSITEK